jgi:hypothetical protein
MHQVFKHVSKPIQVLADPDRRDDPYFQRRIAKHLEKITPQSIRENLDADLMGFASVIQESLEDNLTQVHNELYRELSAVKREREQARLDSAAARTVLERVAKLEENERLSNRISTEKRDEIKPNAHYPTIPANEECIRRSRIAMHAQMKINEKNCSFESDPYNYLHCLALESNKVAEVHMLTKSQQRDLILANIPSQDPNHSYLKIAETLESMFKMISTLASNVLTISDLERKINDWHLDNSTDKAMYKSITVLIDLLTRSMMNRNGNQPINYPELFKAAIGRIQRVSDLPHFTYKALTEGRLRIRDTDSIAELNDILIGALNPYIGYKAKQNNRLDSWIPHQSRVFGMEYESQEVAQGSCETPTVETSDDDGDSGTDQEGTVQGNRGSSDSGSDSGVNSSA